MTDTIRVYYDDFVETTKKAKKYDEVECALTNIKAEVERELTGYPPSADYYKAISKALEIINKYKGAGEC